MRRLIIVIAIAIDVNVYAADPIKQTPEWQLIDEREGIQVFKQNDDQFATITLRGTATIDAPIQETYDVMKDSSRSPEWVPMVIEKKDLRTLSPTSRIESSLLKMPWPLQNRLFVNIASVEFKADGSYHMSLKGIESPDESYLNKHTVLGIVHHSEFILRPKHENQCELFVEVNTDPKGLVPKWMVNMAQKEWPRNFFLGLRKQILKTRQERLDSAH